MLPLRGVFPRTWDADPFVARVTEFCGLPNSLRGQYVLVINEKAKLTGDVTGFRAHVGGGESPWDSPKEQPEHLIECIKPDPELREGDVIRVNPRRGAVRVIYRRRSKSNALFVTNRCNSGCVMCSQPPTRNPDAHLAAAAFEAIPLIDRNTDELGVTGGEPTLLGEDLIRLVGRIRSYLPSTHIHMLTNARLLKYLSLTESLASAGGGSLSVGVPLYSDLASEHDDVVQAEGAFDETIRGLLNLQRCGVAVELRTVLHGKTIPRLLDWARFVRENLVFVAHVALMGMETTGFAQSHAEELWVDPLEYRDVLGESVEYLHRARLNVSVFNVQLCVISPSLWPFCRQSISDWKNAYRDVCEGCGVKSACCGFFETDGMRSSKGIAPVAATVS